MFLSKEEIVKLTGRKFKTMQIKWLLQQGYKFEVTANGDPIVLTAHLNERLGGHNSKSHKASQPNFSNTAIFG